jgi:hypothetical protein
MRIPVVFTMPLGMLLTAAPLAMLFAAAPLAMLLAAAPLAAQGSQAAELQRELQGKRAEVDRLIELRLRHDLGLPVEADREDFRSPEPVTTAGIERSQRELRDEEAATASLLVRYNRLKADVDQLRADASARAKARSEQSQFIVVPRANYVVPPRSRPAGDGEPPAAPSGEVAASPSATQRAAAVVGLDPIRGQIHGSADHQRVAHALFRAGQVLSDRATAARAAQQEDLAVELDNRAEERLQRAVDELAPLLKGTEAPFHSLFCLGRCRELLFRISQRRDGLSPASTREYQRREQEVREPFLAITARDVQRQAGRGEVEVLGPWGQAAQAAMEHFRWVNLNGGYDPLGTIEGLNWPGEREQ